MSLTFLCEPDETGVTLRPEAPKPGLFARLAGARGAPDLTALPADERVLALALADLRAAAEELGADALAVEQDRLRLSHRLAAALDGATAAAIGLPPLVDLEFATDIDGVLGAPNYRLRYRWERDGRQEPARRTGSILTTTRGLRRIPAFLLDAISVAEGLSGPAALAEQWAALGRFRRALEPGAAPDGRTNPDMAARLRMGAFLAALRVRVADALALSPFEAPDGLDFDPVPFSRDALARRDGLDAPGEAEGELDPSQRADFAEAVRRDGAKPAYRLRDGGYLVIDPAAAPALEVMAAMQRAPARERDAFVRNPAPAIAAAVRARLAAEGRLAGLEPDEADEAVETAAGPLLVETLEFSARVVGVGRWEPPTLPLPPAAATTWLPEDFDTELREELAGMDPTTLRATLAAVQSSLATPDPQPVTLPSGREVRPDRVLASALEARLAAQAGVAGETGRSPAAPVTIITRANFFDEEWAPDLSPREAAPGAETPDGNVATPLLAHQSASLDWLRRAWRAGLPGVLNADEPGLGKTLQTLAFLSWLRRAAPGGGPVLIVAPTSLLGNWEAEVGKHLGAEGLGRRVRLHGGGIDAVRRPGGVGMDIADGDARLELDALLSGGPVWALTTYATLTNYQHSLARVRFAAIVFDEIQALKNPASLRAAAARAMNGAFRIGLTGTPIENRTVDLWAVMDQLAPGALGSLRAFSERYGAAEPEALRTLHARLFAPTGGLPPLAIRRLKEDAAADLPPKRRLLHARVMPPAQAAKYDAARLGLARGGRGDSLRLLHHIRTVSAHPDIEAGVGDPEAFVEASARLSLAMEVLRMVKVRGERALVFIEHRRLQHRFAELARREFGLSEVPIINGETPPARRTAIVDRFQRHILHDEGFDLLILAPRAAGVGLTLTAANHVIHLSRWWNPAVEAQCDDRAHRIGQRRPVTVHVLLAAHPEHAERSFDCLLERLMARKRGLARAALWPSGDTPEDAEVLQRALRQESAAGRERKISVGDVAGQRARAIAPGVWRIDWDDGYAGGMIVSEVAAQGPSAPDCDALVLADGGLPVEGYRHPPVTRLSGALTALWPHFTPVGSVLGLSVDDG